MNPPFVISNVSLMNLLDKLKEKPDLLPKTCHMTWTLAHLTIDLWLFIRVSLLKYHRSFARCASSLQSWHSSATVYSTCSRSIWALPSCAWSTTQPYRMKPRTTTTSLLSPICSMSQRPSSKKSTVFSTRLPTVPRWYFSSFDIS